MNFMKRKRKMLFQVVMLIFCMFFCTANAIAHSGRTDSSGGHRDNQNKSGLGSYHYHCGGNPPHLHDGGGCPYSGGGSDSSESVSSAPSPSILVTQIPSELHIGDSSGVEYSVNNASDSWSKIESSDSEIVRVNEDNTLTALKEGKVTITISATETSKTFSIVVKSIPVEAVNLNVNDLELQLGQEQTLEASAAPENATDKTLTWTSNDTKIIEVSESGQVIGKGVGTTTVVCEAGNGVQGICNINVFEVFPQEIKADVDQIEIECGEKISTKITVEPENANNKNYSCKIIDESIAAVDKDGVVIGKADGKTKLLISTENGVEKEIPVTVYHKPVTDVLIDSSMIDYKFTTFSDNIIDHKDKLNFTVNVKPENATFRTIEWASSDPEVIRIVDGKPVIKGAGKVTLTAKTHDGVSSSISFHVINEEFIYGLIVLAVLAITTIPSGIIVTKKRRQALSLKENSELT